VSSPKPPKPTEAQLQQEAEQMQASALLDKQENERRKRLLNAAAGVRAFAGSAITRAAPSDTAVGAPSASQAGTAGSFVTSQGGSGGGRGGPSVGGKPF
jgi:hypothetical protein